MEPIDGQLGIKNILHYMRAAKGSIRYSETFGEGQLIPEFQPGRGKEGEPSRQRIAGAEVGRQSQPAAGYFEAGLLSSYSV